MTVQVPTSPKVCFCYLGNHDRHCCYYRYSSHI